MSLEKRIKGLLNVDSLRVNNISTGTSVNNLGVDSNGNVVIGTTGGTDTNTFVTGGTLSGNDLILEKNNGVDVNPIDLSGLVSGKTDLTLFDSHTGDTNNPHQTSFSNLTSTAHTHTISDVTNLQSELDSKLNVSDFNTYSGDVQTQIDSKLDITTFNTYTGNTQSILDTKISGGTNLSTTGIFAQKNGLDLEFKGLTSTGGTVNISSNSNTVNLEVTIPTDQDKFVSGGTYNTGTQEINFVGNSPETTFDVDLSSIISVDTYVTGFTFNPSTYDLTIKQNEGQPDLVSNLAVLASDVYVVSGVYNPTTGIVTYTNSSGGTFQVSGFTTGMTDSYTTAANLNGETIEFDNNIQGSNLYSVSLTPILSGKTDLTLFNSHTGDTTIHYTKSSINLSELGSTAHTHTLSEITDFNTYSGNVQTQIDSKTNLTLFNSHTGDTNNPHQTSFSNLSSTAHTHTISDVINLQSELDSKLDITTFNTYSGNVQTQLDTKIENGINSGGTNEVFSGKSGTDLYFRTISGGSNTTITTIDDIIRVDVTIPPDTNTFVTGGTYNESTDTITLTRNDGNTIEITGVTDTFTTGGTYNDSTAIITFTKNDSTTYDVDLTSLPATDEVTIEVNSLNEIALKEVVGAPTGGTRTFDSFITITSGLTLNNLGTGTSVNNLGIDINGNVVIGTTGGTDTNTFVTGGTYTTGTLTLDRNDGNSVLVTGFLTGNTLQEVLVNGNTSGGNDIIMTEGDDVVFNYGSFANYVNTNPLTANRNILFPDKDGTVALISDTTGHTENFYVTGGTYSSGTLTLDRNDGDTVTVTGFTTGGGDNFYVTGFTYNDANTLTISRNGGLSDLSATINTLTGLTINGVFSASTYTGLTLNDLDDVTTNIPATPDNTYQGELMYFDVVSNQWVSGSEYGNLGEVTIWGKKGSVGTIDKGCPVYIVGFDDDIHEVELANATTATTMPVIGFTAEDFDNAGVYPIVTFGKITGLDTTSGSTTLNPFGETWEVNDVLYMAKSDGGLTKNRPSGTNTQIQRIAKVLKVDTTSGQLFIFNTARTAGLPNLTTDYLWLGNGNDTPQEVIRTDVGITTTGFSYNDNNTFTITDDNGGSLSATINQVSGLTINGDLDVIGDTTLNTLTATSITSNSAIDVFNGHINLRDNSYFLQGRTVADGNVSLIGVDSQDRVFVGNAGYDTYIDSDTIVDGSLTATTLNITTIGTGALVNNLGVDANGNVVSGNTNTGIYGGDGTIPLNTTASVNGDLTFQGLDEDTRIILKDGNNGGEVHLFSDGSAGQSALEFYNPGGVTLTSKIQNAGGDTRFISNSRDLLFTTNTGVTTEGIFIQAGTGNMGIGTTSPLVELHVKGDSSILRLETTSANNSNYIEFYDPSERKGWIGYPSSTSSTDALFIRNEEHGSKIIISNTDSGGTSRTAIDIDANHNVSLPFGDLDISGTLTIGALGTGTSVTNLGVDSNGNVVSGTTGGGTGVSDANKIFSWFMNVT